MMTISANIVHHHDLQTHTLCIIIIVAFVMVSLAQGFPIGQDALHEVVDALVAQSRHQLSFSGTYMQHISRMHHNMNLYCCVLNAHYAQHSSYGNQR